MKNNIFLYFIFFLLSPCLHSMDETTILATIFAPAPLLELHDKDTWQSNSASFLKKATIPLTCCFYYGIKKNDLWTDVMNNPYTSSICIYAMIHYYTYLAQQNQQLKIDKEIIDMMQHIFHLLIIGHGIYNKISVTNLHEHKTSTAINISTLTTLQLFLHKAYNTWFI